MDSGWCAAPNTPQRMWAVGKQSLSRARKPGCKYCFINHPTEASSLRAGRQTERKHTHSGIDTYTETNLRAYLHQTEYTHTSNARERAHTCLCCRASLRVQVLECHYTYTLLCVSVTTLRRTRLQRASTLEALAIVFSTKRRGEAAGGGGWGGRGLGAPTHPIHACMHACVCFNIFVRMYTCTYNIDE